MEGHFEYENENVAMTVKYCSETKTLNMKMKPIEPDQLTALLSDAMNWGFEADDQIHGAE